MLKNLVSLLKKNALREEHVVPDYSQVSRTMIATLYEEAYTTLHYYVEFSWAELQQQRPGFVAFQDRALAIEAAHDVFLKHYAHYLGLLRELSRCDIEPKSLSRDVQRIIEKLKPHESFEKSGILLSAQHQKH